MKRWSGRRVVLTRGTVGPWLLRMQPDLRRVFTMKQQLAAYAGPERSLAEWLAERGYSPLAAHIADLRIAHAYCATPTRRSAWPSLAAEPARGRPRAGRLSNSPAATTGRSSPRAGARRPAGHGGDGDPMGWSSTH